MSWMSSGLEGMRTKATNHSYNLYNINLTQKNLISQLNCQTLKYNWNVFKNKVCLKKRNSKYNCSKKRQSILQNNRECKMNYQTWKANLKLENVKLKNFKRKMIHFCSKSSRMKILYLNIQRIKLHWKYNLSLASLNQRSQRL